MFKSVIPGSQEGFFLESLEKSDGMYLKKTLNDLVSDPFLKDLDGIYVLLNSINRTAFKGDNSKLQLQIDQVSQLIAVVDRFNDLIKLYLSRLQKERKDFSDNSNFFVRLIVFQVKSLSVYVNSFYDQIIRIALKLSSPQSRLGFEQKDLASNWAEISKIQISLTFIAKTLLEGNFDLVSEQTVDLLLDKVKITPYKKDDLAVLNSEAEEKAARWQDYLWLKKEMLFDSLNIFDERVSELQIEEMSNMHNCLVLIGEIKGKVISINAMTSMQGDTLDEGVSKVLSRKMSPELEFFYKLRQKGRGHLRENQLTEAERVVRMVKLMSKYESCTDYEVAGANLKLWKALVVDKEPVLKKMSARHHLRLVK